LFTFMEISSTLLFMSLNGTGRTENFTFIKFFYSLCSSFCLKWTKINLGLSTLLAFTIFFCTVSLLLLYIVDCHVCTCESNGGFPTLFTFFHLSLLSSLALSFLEQFQWFQILTWSLGNFSLKSFLCSKSSYHTNSIYNDHHINKSA
jgi:hypothetical protein